MTSGAAFGGLERQLLHLVAFLGARGGPPPIACIQHDHTIAARLQAAGVAVTLLGAGRARAARRLSAALADARVEIVHAHDRPSTLLAALARPPAAAFVRTVHNRFEPPAGRGARARAAASFMAEQLLVRRYCDAACYPSHDLAGRFYRWHAPLVRRVIPNGVPPRDAVRPARPADLPRDGIVFGAVGRLSREKGLDVALRALASPSAPRDARLVVLGRGKLRPSLEAEGLALGLGDRVQFLGYREDVGAYLAHLDALVLPSRHEGLPFAALEAMAAGCPVVAARVGGVPELVTDGRTGLLFPAEDAPALARQLARLAGSADLRGRLAAAGREHVARHFTRDAMGEGHLALYRAALAARRRARGPRSGAQVP